MTIKQWFDKQPYIYHGDGCLFTEWFNITDKSQSKIKELRNTPGVQVDEQKMLVRRVYKLKQ